LGFAPGGKNWIIVTAAPSPARAAGVEPRAEQVAGKAQQPEVGIQNVELRMEFCEKARIPNS
jgi:hypothetical protein